MAESIPRDFIDRLVEDSDVVAVLSHYLNLTKKGNNFTCCCPFHDEKTPSFVVSPQKSIYHCFGCGKGGNVITFIKDYEGLNFVEAVEKLAELNNVTVPKTSSGFRNDHSKSIEINQIVSEHYYEELSNKSSEHIVSYLKGRGISGKTAKHFKLGFADFNQNDLLAKLQKRFDEKDILDSGCFLKNEKGIYPFFRKRLIFPILNSAGKNIGFGGRVIDDAMPKYLNSKDSKFFNKARELYGYSEAKKDHKNDYFVVTEGYMDVVMLHEYGVTNAVASLGTAFSQNHLNLLFKTKRKVIFCFDSDEAGLAAAWRALQISLKNVFDDKTVRFLFLPEGYDPDSFVKEKGANEFLKKIDRAMVIETFVFQFLKRGRNLDSPEDIRQIIFELKKLLPTVKSETLRETLLLKFSKELEISKDLLIKADDSQKKPIKKPVIEKTNNTFEKESLLIVYLMETFMTSVIEPAKEFNSFLQRSSVEELKELREVIDSMLNNQKNHKEMPFYAKAMMINFELTTEEATNEFNRASDAIRLQNDEKFIEFLKNLVKTDELTAERKENLQKLLNLRDNISTQEEELIRNLNK